jgi:hypothetical protein
MTTPPATPPTYGHLCTTLHDLLAHHYGTQFTDTDLDAAAEAAARWLDDILAGSHPRLGQLTPRDEAEAHYALNAALGVSPQLRAEVDAQSGRRAENAAHMVAGYALLTDLDRCPHGRHDTDTCLACPECDHALIPVYRRSWGRKIRYQRCVSCAYALLVN